ncbi:hypothetical protein [Candidatus Avelusimicrobium facis]|uniref:hypothetical protein n=1 Tax=Candidatus Avelusimicrobium facis TaxID=3416203 RepID=UPI003D13F39B
MPKRNIHFIWRQRGQNEEDEIIRKQNSFQKEKPYTTLEFRIPKDRWEWENNTSDFFERYPDKKDDYQLHPLRKQYLESRLKDIDYQERQQMMQDSFTTAMYGKKDYSEERNEIMRELNGDSKIQFVGEQKEESSSGPQFTPSDETSSDSGKENTTPSDSEFTPADPDEPSDFNRRKELWEDQQRQENPDEQDIFERLNIPDPKQQPENSQTQWKKPNGQSTEEWDKKNEEWRNKPRKDKNGNIIGSTIRCNTTIGRELSKLDIDVQKGVDMNTMIDGMDKSGDWANLPTDKKGHPDHKEATKLAKEGYIVVATEKGKEHGHAAILTGKEVESGTWKGKVPEVYGSVNGKPAKAEGISIHWQAKDKNNIEYKVYRDKRPI